ncbi:hypothetical protein SKAU_G00009050 [Synaphobranchus kaupii]|uniref:Uncharacterized protein n=1 Tax=Synaphobranchus kaupii TaxID=118154 RepID=A0A9Q1JD52_SYNKA|nr:hypothetical protein SKAU_G00009050 [Synaphobranchus kaupii]
MSGKIWRFSCCQKRKDRGQHFLKTKQKAKEIHGVSQQPSTGGIDIAHVIGGQSEVPEGTTEECQISAVVEQKQTTGIEDQGDHVHDENISIEGVTLNGFEQKYFADKVAGSLLPPSEWERDYQLTKRQLETAQKEKHELEVQVHQANQEVRDLRHEFAVLQKRLQVAENRLPKPPPLCPPPPPPLPPPAQPHVNPLRALLTIIQKRRNSRDPNICQLQDVGPLPGSPEDTDVSYNHRCPGMNDVLELIRGGVPLRHVIQVHKGTFRAEADGAEPGGSQPAPELQEILKKRKVSADKHISDGSCDGSMEEDRSPHGPSVPRDDPIQRSSPSHPENFTQDTGGTDCGVYEGQCDGDAASTASTLPLTSPLDQSQVDSVNASPCPESPALPLSTDGPSMDTSNGQPQLEAQVGHWAGSTDQRTSSAERDFPTDHKVTDGTSLQSSCSPNLTDQTPALQYLNWERWNGVDLKAALPFKSIFKSVSFMANSNGGEVVTLQNEPHHGGQSASLEALESNHSCQSFGSAEFSESTPDVLVDAHAQFSLLHDMLRPPL